MAIQSTFGRLGGRDVGGSAVDPDAPDATLVVDVLIDGIVFATVRADRRLPDLAGAGGTHGFCVTLPDEAFGEACLVEARLSNLGLAVGHPLAIAPFGDDRPPQVDAGEVEWQGGLRIAGWTGDLDGSPLSVLVDGVAVADVRPTAWRRSGGADARAARAFAAHLPETFADGRVHTCAVLTRRGEELRGSPFAVFAFADGLRSAMTGVGIAERDLLRAELFDRLVPGSLPFTAEAAWQTDHAPLAATGVEPRCAVVLIGSEAAALESIESLRRQSHPSWVAAVLPAGTGPTAFEAADLRLALDDAADCGVVLFALAGSIFRAAALRELTAALAAHSEADAAYADIAVQDKRGGHWPLALPALDYERLLEQGYCALCFALRRAPLERALAAGAGDLPALLMALFEPHVGAAPQILHVPGVIATLPHFDRHAASGTLAAAAAAHLARCGITAAVDTGTPGLFPAVRVLRTPSRGTRTSVLIPTRNRRDLLDACLTSIGPAAKRHRADIIVIDNDSSDQDTLAYLSQLPGRGIAVVRAPGPFNFARLINRGAEQARGDTLCLLNNDIVALDADWLGELLGRLADDDVGAVAPLLSWPSGVVQHGGLVLGPCFEAAPAFTDRLDGDPGYADMLRVARECSAVTAACLLTRKRDFFDLGGMDELHFPINFNDVDYCLKLREAGRRIVFTPHARLLHAESSSRGRSWSPDRRALFQRERRHLQLKWGEAIADDPYYSPLLTLGPQPFSGLSAPARPQGPRFNRAPMARDIPEGAS